MLSVWFLFLEMENDGSEILGEMDLMNELVKGRDLGKLLQSVLLNDPSSPSNDTRQIMVHKIIASFERSIRILKSQPFFHQMASATVESPCTFSGSPKSQDSDADFKDLDSRDEHRKSRKIFPVEKRKVPGCSGLGLEGPIEDGFNWRKYGQKDILGAKYPRAYYRCTFRQVQECYATKQVQRSDEDPTFFDVTYRGKHSCSQAAAASSSLPYPTDIKPDPTETRNYHPLQQEGNGVIWSFETEPKDIKPIISTNNNHINNPPAFSFHPSSSNPIRDSHHVPSTFLDNNNSFTNHPNFSDINDTNNGFSDQQQQGEYAAATSATNSPDMAPEFSFDHNNIMFDCSQFF